MIDALKATMREFYRAEAPASGGRVIEHDGLTAFMTPSAPTQSIVNGVLFDDVAALGARLPELARAYRAADVTHWMVWTMPGEQPAAELLRAAGHLAEYEPMAMSLTLTQLVDPAAPDVHVTLDRDPHPLEITTLNERANGEAPGAFGTAFAGLRDRSFHRYVARVEGRPAACLVTFDHDGDCMVNWVATEPRLQRCGIGQWLAHAALLDARERGMRTATLQSSYEAERLYERLGFVAHGRLGMWLWDGPATVPGSLA
ncbi:GNAT family N-acetyltransferase [Conexibacter sp. CPCC 206217]|uniref:GNAT family N-acetyltransferase n=1 Tax=Conexibacter sp. CPCC 206217 TaxID=3064574 RepID=UPI002718D4B5|nr:GNAT family N-acetyltransferase [Conexibacter sp. CPCC 206217]MDO8211879.1 GNAT family N-acetyltransferase [Conexibacter sp. CPCC 206217]